MPLFPAVKFMDLVIGVDIHAVAPIPGIPVHPYVGPVYLWATPVFPSVNVFINGMPACTVGALGYFAHIPQGVPVPPTPTNQGYWKRYFVNIPMVLVLTGLTMLANIAIAGIASLIPKSKSAESFIKDVTGVDTSTRASTWQSIKGMFENYSKWQTWAQLLMPPLPYPGAQGSVAVGSPNVTVNGAALAFVGPLLGTSCSDIPVVPNACTLGFSNVLVGVSFADMLRGVAVAAAQRGVQHAVSSGVEHATSPDEEAPPASEEPAEEQNNKCDDGSHPVSQATGAAWSAFTDINAPHFRLKREVRSTWCAEDGPFGFGMRHDRQYTLAFEDERAVLTDPDNRQYRFRRNQDGDFAGIAFGWSLERRSEQHYALRHGSAGTLVFQRMSNTASHTWLLTRIQAEQRERYVYDERGLPTCLSVDRAGRDGWTHLAEIILQYDKNGHIIAISGLTPATSQVALGSYTYDEHGRMVCFTDALGGTWTYGFDPANRMLRETNPNGYSFHYAYDGEGRCVRAAGDDGLWRAELTYAPGRTLMVEADNGIWAYAIDERRTITEITDPYGGKRQRAVGADGRVLAEIDAGGRAMRNLFDAQGRYVGRLDRWGNRWPTPDEAPRLPNPLAHIIPLTARDRECGTHAAGLGGVSRQFAPRLRRAVDAAIPPARLKPPSSRSDLLGRVIERVDRSGRLERFRYDPAGNCIETTDADGRISQRHFTSWNLCVARTNAAGETVQYRYTKREKLAAVMDAGGATSKYIYDCKDRLTHVTRHGVLRESYRYDAGDRLIEKLDGDGKALLTFKVGDHGLHSQRTLASGSVHNFNYDEHGHVTEASTDKAQIVRRYDGAHRLADLRDGRGVEHRWAGERLVATTYFGRFTVRYETLATGDTLIHPPVGRAPGDNRRRTHGATLARQRHPGTEPV